jgi:hypothetical protein
MSLQFESAQQEKAFDAAVSQWIRQTRYPGTTALALVMERAQASLKAAGLPPSVSALERAYRELYAEKAVPLVTEKLVVPDAEPTLTAEAYHKIPASEVARRLLRGDSKFRDQINSLIERKLI